MVKKQPTYWEEVAQTATKTVSDLKKRREQLEAEMHKLDAEIIQFETVIAGLAPLSGETFHEFSDIVYVKKAETLTLAEIIREVLKQNPQHRTARGIRDSIKVSGYDIARHSNPLASIHGILKRMVHSGEVTKMVVKDTTYYRWKSPHPISEAIEDLKERIGNV